MKIGEIAQRLSTTTRTLRFYEELGLVHPRRSAGGTRYYDEADLKRFEAILCLAKLEIPLKEIVALARTRPQSSTGDEASRRVHKRLAGMREALAERRRALARAERDLSRAEQLVGRCFGCENPPTRVGCADCPAAAGMDSTTVMHLVWEEDRDGASG